MTTRLIIKNAANSNGDVHIHTKCGGHHEVKSLTPGESHEAWIATDHYLDISESWPTTIPASDEARASERAAELIAKELNIQGLMWGSLSEHMADGQCIAGAQAQLNLIERLLEGDSPERATAHALLNYYPEDWEGLRSYGSIVANLAVAAAFIQKEMARRIMLGEDTTRSARMQPYVTSKPHMSSEEALAAG